MGIINDKTAVREQYNTADKLHTRINIHEKYSTNKLGFNNWIFKQYEIPANGTILELGCGSGIMWKDNYKYLPHNCTLILTDLSEGMLEETKEALWGLSGITYRTADIQNILPFNCKVFIIRLKHHSLCSRISYSMQ